jgi:hypothetical protein
MVFSIFYNGILNPFPYRDANRLMSINVMDDRNATRQFRPVFHLDEIVAFRIRITPLKALSPLPATHFLNFIFSRALE